MDWDWRFLKEWEEATLAELRAGISAPPNWAASQLLAARQRTTFDPATPLEIETAEARLGSRLPPDLRQFFELTNGWLEVAPRVRAMSIVPVDELEWLVDVLPESVRDWMSEEEDLPDREYFNYGPLQTPSFRTRYLSGCLLLSRPEDEEQGLILVNPEIRSPEGCWETWFLWHVNGGTTRWPSFHDFMVGRWRTRGHY